MLIMNNDECIYMDRVIMYSVCMCTSLYTVYTVSRIYIDSDR